MLIKLVGKTIVPTPLRLLTGNLGNNNRDARSRPEESCVASSVDFYLAGVVQERTAYPDAT